MAEDTTINGLSTALAATAAADDLLAIWDTSAGATKKHAAAYMARSDGASGNKVISGSGRELTIPATGTAAELEHANVFTANQEVELSGAKFTVSDTNATAASRVPSVVLTSNNSDGHATWRIAVSDASGTELFRIDRNTAAGNDFSSLVVPFFIDSGQNVFAATLTGSGNRAVYSTSGGALTNSSSDATLKTDVVAIAAGEALALVAALQPVRYNWIDGERRGEQREIGLIAQEVAPHVPEVVGVNADGTLSLDYPKLTALLIGAVQELTARVAALEAAAEPVE